MHSAILTLPGECVVYF